MSGAVVCEDDGDDIEADMDVFVSLLLLDDMLGLPFRNDVSRAHIHIADDQGRCFPPMICRAKGVLWFPGRGWNGRLRLTLE